MGELFGTDGVRGIANDALDFELAFKLGMSATMVFARSGKKPLFIIGRDTRISGDMLQSAIACGIMSAGGDVIDAGVIPTPAIAMLTRTVGASAGVVISASHNPYEYNGIKFFSDQGLKLPDATEQAIEQIVIENRSFTFAQQAQIGTQKVLKNAKELYCHYLLSKFPYLNLTGKTIVLDTANGAAFEVAPKVFESLGCRVVVMNNQPNGININQDCGSTHMHALQQRVLVEGACMGLAFDGDADRLLAVDERGMVVDGDQIMFILANHLKAQNRLRNNTVVATVMSNLALKIALSRRGIAFRETAVGDKYVMECILNEGYNFGGEQSGHIICYDINSTGDGLATALMLCETMIMNSAYALSQLTAEIQPLPQVLINARIREENKKFYMQNQYIAQRVAMLEAKYAQNGRVLIRPSGTEPLVRVMIEGNDTAMIQRDAKELADLIEMVLG